MDTAVPTGLVILTDASAVMGDEPSLVVGSCGQRDAALVVEHQSAGHSTGSHA